MTTRSGAIGGLLCAWLAGGCSTRFLPPPAVPARVASRIEVPAPPLREGEGQVTLDATTGPARVELITERTQVVPYATGMSIGPRGYNAYAPATQYRLRPLCLAPCAVNLPLGTHELFFSAEDVSSGQASTAFVNVTATPSILRHAMGRQTSSVGGIVGTVILGGLGVATSLAGGLLMGFQDSSRPDREDFALAGGITLGVGVALGVGAVVLGFASRPVVQPGSSVQWVPSGP